MADELRGILVNYHNDLMGVTTGKAAEKREDQAIYQLINGGK